MTFPASLRSVLVLSALTLACGGPGPGSDAAECDVPTAGCPCSREGDVVCLAIAASGLACRRDGTWGAFVDDPCRPNLPDGSVTPDCTTDPTAPSCPCTCDQERVCIAGGAVRHCLTGTWRANPATCTPGPTCSDAGP